MLGDVFVLAKGIVIGLMIAIPVGPIAILCLKRTIAFGRPAGFATGLGAASADAVVAIAAATGLTAVDAFVSTWHTEIQSFGGAFLLCLAALTVARPLPHAPGELPVDAHDLAGAFVSSIILTLTNPLTVLGFVGVFAAFGVATSLLWTGSVMALVIGVFLGSAAWWLSLAAGISHFRHHITEAWLEVINQGAAAALALFGLLAISGMLDPVHLLASPADQPLP